MVSDSSRAYRKETKCLRDELKMLKSAKEWGYEKQKENAKL